MTPRHARIALAGFAVFAAAVTYNALYRQGTVLTPGRGAEDLRARTPAARSEPAEKPAKFKAPGEQGKRSAVQKGGDVASVPEKVDPETIRAVQRELTQRGYRPGPTDGRLGTETVAAIKAFENDLGMVPAGRVSAEVLTLLQVPGPVPVAQAERGS